MQKKNSNVIAPEERSEAWYFAQELRGLSVPRPAAPASSTESPENPFIPRSLGGSPMAEDERTEAWYFAQALRGNPEVGRPKYLTAEEWEAEHEQWLRDVSTVYEQNWDPSKHPRGGNPKNTGQFSEVPGSSSKKSTSSSPAKSTASTASTKSSVSKAVDPKDPSRWYLPSDNRGTWSGDKGASTFKLNEPVNVNGRLIHEIEYKKGLPVLEKHALPGITPSIVLTGNNTTDIRNAKTAWLQLNPGKSLPPNTTFHHDLLHVVEETIEIDGKKTKVLVGKMHLVPTEINRIVFHEGSASVAANSIRE
jgi:hypothetical protein